MNRTHTCWLAGALVALCSSPMLQNGAAHAAKQTSQNHVSDDVVLEWNEIAVTTIGAQPPFPSTRVMATVQLAVFEAVNLDHCQVHAVSSSPSRALERLHRGSGRHGCPRRLESVVRGRR